MISLGWQGEMHYGCVVFEFFVELLQGTDGVPCTEPHIDNSAVIPVNDGDDSGRGREAVAIDCAIVGGGSDGSLDLCARVCLVDEDENIVFHTYIVPHITITDYR